MPMRLWFELGFAATLFLAISLLIVMFATRRSRATARRIREVTLKNGRTGRRFSAVREMISEMLASVRWLRVQLGISDETDLEQRLSEAGYKGTNAVDLYNAARFLGPLLALGCAISVPVARIFWILALPATAFIAPNMVLTRLIARRREKIRLSLPDTLDLLVICVDAGLGIDQALLRVGRELGLAHPQITEELLQLNREQRAGKPRIQAWADMATRAKLKEIDAFASMLAQTERFGTPIARALSTFADTIRLKRRQRAEEMAAKTTVKIVFPLVFCIFPSLFIVLLAPAIFGIMRGLTGVGQ